MSNWIETEEDLSFDVTDHHGRVWVGFKCRFGTKVFKVTNALRQKHFWEEIHLFVDGEYVDDHGIIIDTLKNKHLIAVPSLSYLDSPPKYP
jgi:hypothetical protein